MIFVEDPGDPSAISGMPYSAARALERRGCTIVPLEAAPRAAQKRGSRKATALAKRLMPPIMREWPARLRSSRPGCVFGPALEAGERVAERICEAEREAPIDALFGFCVSVPLAFL